MTSDDRALILSLAQEVGRLAGEAAGMQRAFDALAGELGDVNDEIGEVRDELRGELQKLRTEGVATARWRVTTVISVGALLSGICSLGVLLL